MELYPPIIIHYKYYFLSSYGNLNLILSLMIYNFHSIQYQYKLIGIISKIMFEELYWKNAYFQNFVIFLLLEAFSRIFFIVKLVFGCFEAVSYHGRSIKLTRITRQFDSFKVVCVYYYYSSRTQVVKSVQTISAVHNSRTYTCKWQSEIIHFRAFSSFKIN